LKREIPCAIAKHRGQSPSVEKTKEVLLESQFHNSIVVVRIAAKCAAFDSKEELALANIYFALCIQVPLILQQIF